VPGDFTPAARAAVESAESEARTLRHDHIGTEHLLLGVLAQTDAADWLGAWPRKGHTGRGLDGSAADRRLEPASACLTRLGIGSPAKR